MTRKFDKRIHNLKTQNEDIQKLLNYADELADAVVFPAIEKDFSESINLAVTQVNGCKLCSYTHVKGALKSGMSNEDIEYLLSGSFDNAPKIQLEALLFAQHYAESKGNPDPELKQKLFDIYGNEKANDIMSHILMMMVTNLHGNTMEAFKLRLKRKSIDDSSFWQEFAVIVNFFKIAPVLLPKILKRKIFVSKTRM